MTTLSAYASLDDLVKDQAFIAASPEKKRRYLDEVFLPSMDEGYKAAPLEKRQRYMDEVVWPKIEAAPPLNAVAQPGATAVPQAKPVDLTQDAFGTVPNVAPLDITPAQGLGNLYNAVGEGLAGFGQAAVNPETYQQMGRDIMGAIDTEMQTANKNLLAYSATSIPATTLGILKGVIDLGMGLYNLPGDIQNAYYGAPVVQRTEWHFTPWVEQFMKDRPVTTFLGEQVPYMLPVTRGAQAATATRKASALKHLARGAAEGATYGALIDPGEAGLQGRVANTGIGAALPVALGGAAGLTGKVAKKAIRPYTAAEMTQRMKERIKGRRQKPSDYPLPKKEKGQFDAEAESTETTKTKQPAEAGQADGTTASSEHQTTEKTTSADRSKEAKLIDQRGHSGALDTPYVKSKKTGNTDLGVLPELVYKDEGRTYPQGAVRMHEGNFDPETQKGYGAEKILAKHGRSLAKAGYKGDPAGFVEDMLKDPATKYYWDKKNKSIIAARQIGKTQTDMSAVELVLDPDKNYYSVKSAGRWERVSKKHLAELEVGSASPNDATRSGTSAVNNEDLKTPGTSKPGGRDSSSNIERSTPEKDFKPPGTEKAKQLKAAVDRFAKLDETDMVNYKKTAMEIHKMAQEMTEAEFIEATQHLPQEVLNRLGKEIGC